MSTDESIEHALAYSPRLRKVHQYVLAHLDQPISLEDAARVASLEPKYFSALFKRRTGTGFKRWLVGLRIGHAMELLDSEDLDITSVADRVGFANLRTFQRAFLEHVGTTPSLFRKSRRS